MTCFTVNYIKFCELLRSSNSSPAKELLIFFGKNPPNNIIYVYGFSCLHFTYFAVLKLESARRSSFLSFKSMRIYILFQPYVILSCLILRVMYRSHSFSEIGHVRYIYILTWLRGFQVKTLYLVVFSLCLSLFWELRDKGNLKTLQF